MLSTLLSVRALLISCAILQLGHALGNTLLGVRATLEGFPDWVTGTMMSSYFVGFIIGTNVSAQLVPLIGHIRTFSAFASAASGLALLHVLIVDPTAWILIRFAYGFCVACLFMTMESWLNILSTRSNRGKVLSSYMVVTFVAIAGGQMLLSTADPMHFTLFAITSIIMSMALVPVTLSKRVQQPQSIMSERMSFLELFKVSPLAALGCIGTGLISGAFWGMGAVFLTRLGFPTNQVALFIATTFMGGLLLQWPLGWLSDKIDRRMVIAGTLALSVVSCIALLINVYVDPKFTWVMAICAVFFGGSIYTIYSLYIALANDFLRPTQVVKASAGLLSFHAIGAIFGPLIASLFMTVMGASGLLVHIAIASIIMLLIASRQIMIGRPIPQSTSDQFFAMPRGSYVAAVMDPRQGTKVKETKKA